MIIQRISSQDSLCLDLEPRWDVVHKYDMICFNLWWISNCLVFKMLLTAKNTVPVVFHEKHASTSSKNMFRAKSKCEN
jgi:hypothetical protein